MLTVLLLLSKFCLQSIPVVNIDENVVQNVITEAGVILGLLQCRGHDWFDNLAGKSLHQLGLPVMMRSKEITRYPSHSFQQMGGLAATHQTNIGQNLTYDSDFCGTFTIAVGFKMVQY